MNSRKTNAISAAREHWCTDDLEIDDVLTNKDVSEADDGCWVRAWVWVSNDLISAEE